MRVEQIIIHVGSKIGYELEEHFTYTDMDTDEVDVGEELRDLVKQYGTWSTYEVVWAE
jgi:hypothetical protein